ncbi:MAG: threonylcarbamoyl-AMP synthase [Chloroflexi bacterium]|nr:threonylcarbamoyl-AMP synthase [Chloroflexota bacterium]
MNAMTTHTRVLGVADPLSLSQAVALVRAGDVVAFPTDTVYGLGCDLWQEAAVSRLYDAKDRPPRLAIPVLVASPQDAARVALDLPATFAALAARFWPGGLTLILRRRPEVPALLCAGGETVAVRMPDHAWVQSLAQALGGALAATSANLSGRASPVTADDVLTDLTGRIPLLVAGGRCAGGVASSIVDLVSDPPVLVRAGALTLDILRQVLPTLVPR